MKICYLDAFSGISGDMTVGALIDAGADSRQLVQSLEALGTGARFEVEKTKRRGIAASKFPASPPEPNRTPPRCFNVWAKRKRRCTMFPSKRSTSTKWAR
jgi:uncharacterized protein (DUF111 family)